MADVMAARVSARVGSGGSVRGTSSTSSSGSRRPASGSGAAAAAAIAAASANATSNNSDAGPPAARRVATTSTSGNNSSGSTVAAKVSSTRAPAKTVRQQQHEAEMAQLRIQMVCLNVPLSLLRHYQCLTLDGVTDRRVN
jgi:hypothetical protein